MAQAKIERCENCDAVIGKLEVPYLHDERILCKDCFSRVSPLVPASRCCPACGSKSKAVLHKNGSAVVVLLLVLMLFAGSGMAVVSINTNGRFLSFQQQMVEVFANPISSLAILLLAIYCYINFGYARICPECRMIYGQTALNGFKKPE